MEDSRKTGTEKNRKEGDKSIKDVKALDFTSDKFDAYAALYSKNVHLPNPRAPVLDNLTKFSESEGEVVIKTGFRGKTKENVKEQASTSAKSRFQPHQEPIKGKEKQVAKNVLTRMNNVKGPLSLLQRCMNERIRIKVLTRNMEGIRGYCLGYLLAFDKHFNMALEDVTEVWTRKKHIKIPPLGSCDDVEVPTPRIKIRSSDSKTEECERFVSKLMMRGEHVVIIIANDH